MKLARIWQSSLSMLALRAGPWLRERLSPMSMPPDAERPGTGPALSAPEGEWIAHRTAQGRWILRGAGQPGWVSLGARGFQEFRTRVAAAGGCMTTVEAIPGDAEAQLRRRTVGYWLDGDTRECPAILRQQGGLVEYYYYRLGNPLSYERMGLAARAGVRPELARAA